MTVDDLLLTPVDDIRQRSPDAEALLEDEEFAYQWYLTEIPIGMLDYRMTHFDEEDEARFDDIIDWVEKEHAKDWRSAMLQSPPLITNLKRNNDDWHIIDGCHRWTLAQEAGLTVIPALISFGELTHGKSHSGTQDADRRASFSVRAYSAKAAAADL